MHTLSLRLSGSRTLNALRDHRQIVVELFSRTVAKVPDVIDAFVEAPRKLGSDRLDRHAMVGNRSQKSRAALAAFAGGQSVHRYLGNECPGAFASAIWR